MNVREVFRKMAEKTARVAGEASAFALAVMIVLVWLVTGPYFRYSDTWQLVINTGTTIVTFLMIFLVQNTQNRGEDATQIKLDELLRAVRGARTAFVDLENASDDELKKRIEEFHELHRRATREQERREKKRSRRS